jgi:hypothetical protein
MKSLIRGFICGLGDGAGSACGGGLVATSWRRPPRITLHEAAATPSATAMTIVRRELLRMVFLLRLPSVDERPA